MALKSVCYPSIDAKRKELGLTKNAVAKRLGTTWKTLDKKLEGRGEFSVTEIMTLADWWGLSMDELVGHKVQTNRVLTIRLADGQPIEALSADERPAWVPLPDDQPAETS